MTNTLHIAAYTGCVILLAAAMVLLWLSRHDIPSLEPRWAISLGSFLAIPCVTTYLIRRAQRTPYRDLANYMERWWLFNPYERTVIPRDDADDSESYMAQFFWFPWSFRIHHILRADLDRHLHDHPWNARTFILKGSYIEERLMPNGEVKTFYRMPGSTASLKFGEYHSIRDVSPGGVYTLFVTSRYQGTWGFLVDGVKVPYREYFQKTCEHDWGFGTEDANGTSASFYCHKCGLETK